MTSKIHAIVDALGNPLRYQISAGNTNDCVVGYEMLQQENVVGKNVIADRGYDTDQILEYLTALQANAVIPSRKHRKVQRNTDWYLFKERHLVECFFNKLKHYRRLATRYDKKVSSFLAFLNLASIMLWLR